MLIRKAEPSDYDRILEIYRYAQDYMIRSGNPNQWGRFYPDPELVRNDIENGVCHVLCEDDGPHAVFALIEGPDPTYQVIEDGAWLNAGPYAAIHRVASDGQMHGVFRCVADFCKNLYPSIRIDTHSDNSTMQKQIEKNGFSKCGTIYVEDGSPRIAYQWISQGKHANMEP
ncbi:MAG: N-acetyltransferase [bacterium]|nr:N-acetyltransferase [bacterium]